ncbi:MAG: response regulator [Alistipes onderdonkii]
MECDNSVNPVGNRPRLLVAEDNPSNYKLVEVLLRRDYDLLHAWNGEEAVALFADCRPDLVLMDINMPVMDGYEALRGVREISPDVPVIALHGLCVRNRPLPHVPGRFQRMSCQTSAGG